MRFFSLMLVAASTLASCSPASDREADASGTRASIANPASVSCGKQGGKSETREGQHGQYSMCHLPDGRVREEWALFRDSECSDPGKTASYCGEGGASQDWPLDTRNSARGSVVDGA
jgi:putative hemolysin